MLKWANDAYLRVTMRTREDILGKPMFEAFPSDPDSESFRLLDSSFRRVLATRSKDEIALIRYDIPAADGAMEVRYWSATHTPFLDDEGKVAFILQHTVDVTELQELRTLRDEAGLVARAQAIQTRNRDLRDEAHYLHSMFEQAPGFVALLDGEDHVFRLANAAYRQLVGNRDIMGRSVADALPEVVGQGFVERLDGVYSTGIPYAGRREKVILDRGDHEEPAETYLNFIYQPITNDSGQVTGVLVQGHDVTEEVEIGERQALLINELNHRVKNTLAIVQGLAMQSFRQVEGSNEARRVFDARLAALARAHSLLTSHQWASTSLGDILRASIEASAGSELERFSMVGPDVDLNPQQAVSLAMIIHELTTNAIKYGALSTASGAIELSWSVGGADQSELRFHWQEKNGPSVQAPPSRGFGSRLIERGLPHDRRSSAQLDFHPEGVRFELQARIERP